MQLAQMKIRAVVIAAISLLWLTACGPAALEEKRLADQCNATYGFGSDAARECLDSGTSRLAMHDR